MLNWTLAARDASREPKNDLSATTNPVHMTSLSEIPQGQVLRPRKSTTVSIEARLSSKTKCRGRKPRYLDPKKVTHRVNASERGSVSSRADSADSASAKSSVRETFRRMCCPEDVMVKAEQSSHCVPRRCAKGASRGLDKPTTSCYLE